MKIALINPPACDVLPEYPDERGKNFIVVKDYGRFPPLGLLYIAAYLEKVSPHHEVFVKDCVAEGVDFDAFRRWLDGVRPDLVGVTSFSVALRDSVRLVAIIRAAVPSAHITMGGHHTIAFPFDAVHIPGLDSIIVGEGEQAFAALAGAIEKKKVIENICGVYTVRSIERWKTTAYRDERLLAHVTVPPAYNDDLDSLPFPSRKHIKHLSYYSILGVTDTLATMISSRGCPFRCAFCDVPFKKYRARSAKNVVDEIEECLRLGYKEVHFYDDLFNITPEKVVAFCDELQRRKIVLPWDFRGRVNTVTKESLVRAREAGCRLISFGVETGSDAGLQVLNKGTTIAQVRQVFAWCKELGIKTVADYMIGLPHERSRDDIKRNIDFLIRLDPDYAQISILALYPHTRFYDDASARGLIDPQKWQRFVSDPTADMAVDHWEEFLTMAELVRIRKQSYRSFYVRYRYVMKTLLRLRSFHEFKIKCQGLATLFK